MHCCAACGIVSTQDTRNRDTIVRGRHGDLAMPTAAVPHLTIRDHCRMAPLVIITTVGYHQRYRTHAGGKLCQRERVNSISPGSERELPTSTSLASR
jgi:hypothetical protein